MVDPRLEKTGVIRKVSFQESIPQSNGSWENAAQMTLPFYQ